MVGITHKNTTLRIAIAEATVSVSHEGTIEAIKERSVPKGDVLEMAKTAGLFAVKKTSDMIPDCHPLPVEFTAVTYAFDGLNVKIRMEVHAIYRTGVEVEAMHGVSVVALTMYDMLKPIDKGVEINNIRLVEKKGGKSQWKKFVADGITAQVVVCSDTVSAGGAEDRAGAVIEDKLKAAGVQLKPKIIIPDEQIEIKRTLSDTVNQEVSLLIFTGGTGMSIRDVTPESIIPDLDRRIPGIEEAIRSYGQERTPLAMLSRSVAGVKGNTLVLALPGSTKGAEESMDAIFPAVLHVFKVFRGTRHEA
jgi:molybdenum cofactor biosynthesis protein MoaC